MTLDQKLDILIRRTGGKKGEFAASVGITYRALANYLSGARKPKANILHRIAEALDVDVRFLTDDNREPQLSSEERFEILTDSDSAAVGDARDLLARGRKVFASAALSGDDKQALFTCLTEIYFTERNRFPAEAEAETAAENLLA